jgi:dual specificity phosphatase 12
MADFSQITENIFIGNAYSVIGCYRTKEEDVIDMLNIKTVISALCEDEYEDYMIEKEDFEGIDWHRFVIDDDDDEKISEFFFRVHSIISESIHENKKVIVHCAAGMSRSPTLVMAYLMIENLWTFKDTFNFVKNKRNIVDPNDGFIKQLKGLEYKLKSYNKYI